MCDHPQFKEVAFLKHLLSKEWGRPIYIYIYIKAKMQDSVSNAPLIADRFNEANSFGSVPHETSVILVRVCGWLGVGNNEFDCDAK